MSAPTPVGQSTKKVGGFFHEFKEFILTGDLMTIAVAFIMAALIKDVITSFINDIFDKIATEASRLALYNKKPTITSREIQTAVRLVLPGELAKHAVSEGTKAVAKERIRKVIPVSAEDLAAQTTVLEQAAAGNEASNMDVSRFYPASHALDNIVTVGSTTRTDTLAGSSNFGTAVDLLAPGESILSLGYTNNTGTATLSGTSMAAPQVTGALALLRRGGRGRRYGQRDRLARCRQRARRRVHARAGPAAVNVRPVERARRVAEEAEARVDAAQRAAAQLPRAEPSMLPSGQTD